MPPSRESIFFSTVRSFCVCLAAILGILLGVVLVGMGFSAISGPDVYPEKSQMILLPDTAGNRHLLHLSSPVVLKLDVSGVIGQGDLTAEHFENMLIDSQEGLLKAGRVKAVLLYIDTPGGTVTDSAAIYNMLKAYKKKYQIPLYAFVEGMCASGGMYIASAADKIFATSSSVIGSVGVIMGPAFNFSGLMDRYGVQSMTLTEGKDKDMLNPFRPWQTGEDACLRAVASALYTEFVQIVADARPKLGKDKLIGEYGAQVYVSAKAAELGYIDVTDASWNMALEGVVEAAGLSTPYQVVQLSSHRSLLADIVSCVHTVSQGKMYLNLPLAPNINSELSGKWLYLYQPTPTL